MSSDIELEQLDNEQRRKVLEKLGYSINSHGYVVDGKKEVICKYSGEKVHINTAAILPGSLLIINANPLTIAQYLMDKIDDAG